MKITCITFLLSLTFYVHAQPIEIEWQNTIGGVKFDVPYCIRQTADSGYIVAGFSRSGISFDKIEDKVGGDDYWIIKLDKYGNIIWQNTIGGDLDDNVYSVEQTADGGYFVGGFTFSGISGDKTEANFGGLDYWVLKLDAIGNIEWDKSFGGTEDDELFSAKPTSDGGYILGGSSFSSISGNKTEISRGSKDYWIIKLNATGSIEWQKTIGGSNIDLLSSIEQTIDEGYILAGSSFSDISGEKTEIHFGDNDYWVVKLDAEGNIQWQKTFGGFAEDKMKIAKQTTDGGYILAGYSFSMDNGNKTEPNRGGSELHPDYWVIKLNSIGDLQWQKVIGGIEDDFFGELCLAADNGFLLAGYSKSNATGDKSENLLGGYGDYWIVKLDSTGEIKWDNTLGGDEGDASFSVDNTFDGGYIIAGKSYSNISFDKTEANLGDADYWIVKLLSDGCAEATYYADMDSDGFGDMNTSIVSCSAPDGFVTDATDCDDSNADIHPGSIELCNGIDDNCNGFIDEDITETITISAEGATTFCQGESVLLTAAYSGEFLQWKKNGVNIPGANEATYTANKKGIYTCLTLSTCNTALSNEILVNVQKRPTAVISADGPTSFCAGDSVILTANSGSGLEYQWYAGSSLIPGETGISYTATSTGNYKCRVIKSSSGCFKNSNVISVSVTCREGEISSAFGFSISPNPVGTTLTVTTNSSADNTFLLMDAIGKTLQIIHTADNTIYLDVNNLTAGIYFIKMQSEESVFTQKFIKQ